MSTMIKGTTFKAFKIIKAEGLRRKGRQYVHLSDNIETAILVGKRRTNAPVILEIDVKAAQEGGIRFYKSGDMYLADYINPKYISRLNN